MRRSRDKSTTPTESLNMVEGFTRDNLPVGIEFIRKSFDDFRLLQVAYGYEQATKKREPPQITPPLPGEKFDY
jgi:amidase